MATVKVDCTGTCYMPVGGPKDEVVQRFEDEGPDQNIYEIDSKRLTEFLKTGNFALVVESE